MPRDYRWFVEELKKYDELIEIKDEVDWNQEAACIQAMSNRVGGPACWFRKLKGYDERYTLLGDPFGGDRKRVYRRSAIAMGLPPTISWREWARELMARFAKPLKPTIVTTGPCKEEIHMGKEVNLFEFPLPYLHYGDGGRYGGTLAILVTKDPDSDWVNWGNYRWMAHTRNKYGGDFQVGQHGPDMYYEYERRGQPMHFAHMIGGDPLATLAATFAVPKGQSEVDWVGGLRLEPMELVKTELWDEIYVMANCEVVIEGEVRPYERWDEGPFGEFDGFLNLPRRPQPVYRALCITHRKDLVIWPFCVEGTRFNTSCAMVSSVWGPVLAYYMVQFGLRPWDARNLPEQSWAGVAVAIEWKDKGQIGEAIDWLWSIPFLVWVDHSHLVDWNVDLGDSEEVWEDFGVYLRPDRMYWARGNKPMSNIVAWASIEDKMKGYSTAVVYDTTTHPGDRPRQRMRVEDIYPEEIIERCERIWREAGIEGEFVKKKFEALYKFIG